MAINPFRRQETLYRNLTQVLEGEARQNFTDAVTQELEEFLQGDVEAQKMMRGEKFDAKKFSLHTKAMLKDEYAVDVDSLIQKGILKAMPQMRQMENSAQIIKNGDEVLSQMQGLSPQQKAQRYREIVSKVTGVEYVPGSTVIYDPGAPGTPEDVGKYGRYECQMRWSFSDPQELMDAYTLLKDMHPDGADIKYDLKKLTLDRPYRPAYNHETPRIYENYRNADIIAQRKRYPNSQKTPSELEAEGIYVDPEMKEHCKVEHALYAKLGGKYKELRPNSLAVHAKEAEIAREVFEMDVGKHPERDHGIDPERPLKTSRNTSINIERMNTPDLPDHVLTSRPVSHGADIVKNIGEKTRNAVIAPEAVLAALAGAVLEGGIVGAVIGEAVGAVSAVAVGTAGTTPDAIKRARAYASLRQQERQVEKLGPDMVLDYVTRKVIDKNEALAATEAGMGDLDPGKPKISPGGKLLTPRSVREARSAAANNEALAMIDQETMSGGSMNVTGASFAAKDAVTRFNAESSQHSPSNPMAMPSGKNVGI